MRPCRDLLPGRPEQTKNMGVRTPSADDVPQLDEDLEAEAQEQRRDVDVNRVQRQKNRTIEHCDNRAILVNL